VPSGITLSLKASFTAIATPLVTTTEVVLSPQKEKPALRARKTSAGVISLTGVLKSGYDIGDSIKVILLTLILYWCKVIEYAKRCL
jgi:hypothetical protein